jgi:DNA-binding transcriptional ArsR family regulator
VEANIAFPAALIGDPVRAGILMALCDGRAHPATALARALRVSAQSASNHLARLVAGGLLTVEREGRHRYYRLSRPEVATALEALGCLAPATRQLDSTLSPQARLLRFGRSCYDHLAGQLGVAIADCLEDRRYLLVPRDDSKLFLTGHPKHYALTDAGRQWFADLGIDTQTVSRGRRVLARRCLDWTERQHHLAGALGAALFSRLLELDWLRRGRTSRTVEVTAAGAGCFARYLDIDVRALRAPTNIPGARSGRERGAESASAIPLHRSNTHTTG